MECHRGLIASTIVSFKAGWPIAPPLTTDLLTQLAADMEKRLDPAAISGTPQQLRSFLGLSTCFAAISRVSAEACRGVFPGMLLAPPPHPPPSVPLKPSEVQQMQNWIWIKKL